MRLSVQPRLPTRQTLHGFLPYSALRATARLPKLTARLEGQTTCLKDCLWTETLSRFSPRFLLPVSSHACLRASALTVPVGVQRKQRKKMKARIVPSGSTSGRWASQSTEPRTPWVRETTQLSLDRFALPLPLLLLPFLYRRLDRGSVVHSLLELEFVHANIVAVVKSLVCFDLCCMPSERPVREEAKCRLETLDVSAVDVFLSRSSTSSPLETVDVTTGMQLNGTPRAYITSPVLLLMFSSTCVSYQLYSKIVGSRGPPSAFKSARV